MHTYTHTSYFQITVFVERPKKENNLNCIPKVLLASEQSNKGSEVRNDMLALHLKQLQKRKNKHQGSKVFLCPYRLTRGTEDRWAKS